MALLSIIENGASESDVEQKFIAPLLVAPSPEGLGYSPFDYRTKTSIKKIIIDKGNTKKLYYPDYVIICDGLPLVVIEAKAPGEDLVEAFREARLYAAAINAEYTNNTNPCEKVIATDGRNLLAGFWDQAKPSISLQTQNLDTLDPEFDKFIAFVSEATTKKRAAEILRSIRTTARYFKPVHMLGGQSVVNELIGDNSFGTNISIEYKYLFNPESQDDRAAVIKNAYVPSKRKQSHVAPIDRLIRGAFPRVIINATPIEDSTKPKQLIETIESYSKDRSEICLLIGSVGSGKSTFTDFLRIKALPEATVGATEWVNVNLNQAPLTRDLIYEWVIQEVIKSIRLRHSDVDFDELSVIEKIFHREIAALNKGKAALYDRSSEKYRDILYKEIDELQKSSSKTLSGIIDFFYKKNNKLIVIVLDNCDKRNRDDQLLMFEVASWLKTSFSCVVFLPLRDTTYDQFRDQPPLDTVIKDLIFRIEPPLLDKVIQARLNFATREISSQSGKFQYTLSDGKRVVCERKEVADYLKTIVTSLFQDAMFKRVITGLAGRNIRKGLEILLDFCKSGHIDAAEILKIRTSNGDHSLPNHVIAKILLKGRRRYYADSESNIKNLFHSEESDDLPDPLIRVAILNWLRNRLTLFGQNGVRGFHQTSGLIADLQAGGHTKSRLISELGRLVTYGCVTCEAQTAVLSERDLISISPAGQVHLELLRNVNYLGTVCEDVFFRENQSAKKIADNIVGRGSFKSESRQTKITNSRILIDYLNDYESRFLLGTAKVIEDQTSEVRTDLKNLKDYVYNLQENDHVLRGVSKAESDYPQGSVHFAQITNILQYGFFVEFGLSGVGLVHKTSFGNHSYRILDQIETGDWVLIKIRAYEPERRRYSLELVEIRGDAPEDRLVQASPIQNSPSA